MVLLQTHRIFVVKTFNASEPSNEFKKTRKLSNNLNYHLKDSEKEEQAKPKLSKRKEVIKDERRNKTEIK